MFVVDGRLRTCSRNELWIVEERRGEIQRAVACDSDVETLTDGRGLLPLRHLQYLVQAKVDVLSYTVSSRYPYQTIIQHGTVLYTINVL